MEKHQSRILLYLILAVAVIILLLLWKAAKIYEEGLILMAREPICICAVCKPEEPKETPSLPTSKVQPKVTPAAPKPQTQSTGPLPQNGPTQQTSVPTPASTPASPIGPLPPN